MCEGCGRSANQLQMAPIETSLIDSAWQTVTSAACSALVLMKREKWVMSRANTRRDLTLFCVHTLVRSALIWCHCLFFHLSAEEVVQTPQIVCLMAAALHINSIHCLCELQLPLTLIKYWCPCKHSCHIEYFIQSHSLPPQCGMSCRRSPWEIGPLFLGSLLIYGDKIKCSDTGAEIKAQPRCQRIWINPSASVSSHTHTHVSSVCDTHEAVAVI